QAEDGIRDFHVTGVQACALPISLGVRQALAYLLELARIDDDPLTAMTHEGRLVPRERVELALRQLVIAERGFPVERHHAFETERSEERRVGKERGTRWAADRSWR